MAIHLLTYGKYCHHLFVTKRDTINLESKQVVITLVCLNRTYKHFVWRSPTLYLTVTWGKGLGTPVPRPGLVPAEFKEFVYLCVCYSQISARKNDEPENEAGEKLIVEEPAKP